MLTIALSYLFPDVDFVDQCVIEDDGTGQRIAQWNRPEPQPTEADIQAAMLPALRKLRISQVTKLRTQVKDQRFKYAGKWFQTDDAAMKQISVTHGFVTGTGNLPPSFPGAWKAEDNSYLPIPDVAAWWAFYSALAAAGTANFVHSENLKEQVAASDDPMAIDIEAGWPGEA